MKSSRTAAQPRQPVDRGVTNERPLRVLFVTHDLGRGGTERQLLALSRRLPEHGVRPAFVLIGEAGPYARLAEEAGATVTALGISDWREGRARFVTTALRGMLRHLRAARAGHYDIVDAWLYQGYWLSALTYRLVGIGVFIAGRRSLSDFKDGWRWPARAIDALARGQARLLVANSDAVRSDVIRRERVDPRRIVVVRNGVELPSPPTPASRQAVRTSWGCSSDEFVIGCVANLKPRKGLEHLIRAFAALPSQAASRLVLVGDGRLRAALVDLAAQLGVARNVRFHGSDPDPRRLLPGMDLFVHPSESEGLPNSVLEAAAAGLGIVATDAGGTREIIKPGDTGILVAVGAIEELTAAIESLRARADVRERLGAAAREHVRTTYGMDRFVSETAALYRRLVAGAERSRS